MTSKAHRTILRLCQVIAVPLLLLAGSMFMDVPLARSAKPPANIKTIQEFELWLGAKLKGKGEYQISGTNYTVLLGPAGNTLPSGLSAYLFAPDGTFVDWTSDSGDRKTVKYRWDVSSGLKNYEREKP